MDPRHFIKLRKTLGRQTDWSTDGVPPKWTVLPKTKKLSANWEWRGAVAQSPNGTTFLLCVQANAALDKWIAWLILEDRFGKTLLASLEQHGASGEGIHIHADCDGSERLFGPDSVGASHTGQRLPTRPTSARRIVPLTKKSFWACACKTFRIFPAPSKGERGPDQPDLFKLDES